MKPDYKLIENSVVLKKISGDLAREKTIAVDLESDSMYHFKEKICLIQISAKTSNFIIDPLKANDLTPLQAILSDPNIQKVFHGADYDIRSLFRDYQFEVNNLFDTHLACRFLGIQGNRSGGLAQQAF